MASGEMLAAGPARGTGAFARVMANPHSPFRVLAWMCWASAVICGIYWVFAGDAYGERPAEARSGAVLLVLGVLAWFAAPRLRGSWGLYLCAVVVGAMTASAALGVDAVEGQIVIGLGFMALGLFLAVFLSPREVLVLMSIVCGLYLIAVTFNDHARSWTTYAVVAIIVVAVSWLFAVVVAAMRDQALHDHATGLLNRHGLGVLSGPLVAAARRSGIPVTVLVIDVDRFKLFNDTFGHVAGDDMLRLVAHSWRTACRDSDLVVRYGGDEIVVVLVGASPTLADETIARAEAELVAGRRAEWTESWTVGRTSLRAEERLAEAIRRADDELVALKRGRGTGVPMPRIPD